MALLEAGDDGVKDLGPGHPVSRRRRPQYQQLQQWRHVLLVTRSLENEKYFDCFPVGNTFIINEQQIKPRTELCFEESEKYFESYQDQLLHQAKCVRTT